MQMNHSLTNEKLKVKFSSLFDLVAHAIRRARFLVKTGNDSKIKSQIRNPAFLTLREIEDGKDTEALIQESVQKEVEENQG